jgi:hypothetical protein
VQGDAADEEVISGLCKRALKEEGRLDVFFANVSIISHILCHELLNPTLLSGWRSDRGPSRPNYYGAV